MIRIREAILVEGRYDINTVKQVVDTVAATIILEDYLRHRKAQPTAEP